MTKDTQGKNRRKFIAWGLATAAVAATFKFFTPVKKNPKTVKMLTEEGTLVEVDIASIPSQKKKISNQEMQNFIKK